MAVAFGIIFSIFFIYDVYVQRRIVWLVAKVAHSNSIISSLFPEKIRDRLVNRSETESLLYRKSGTIKSLLDAGAEVEAGKSESLTEHFPKVTVLIADIVGFNSWSADREPSQVFSLLETVYGVFDEIAEKHKVYKIETVSDSYIAVCGLPEPSTKHATAMGRFAREIAKRMPVVCQELEVALGPNTSELSLRVGMHSGPVTAGVLRGERARFQLFGNTVNTCSLVAKTGTAGKIHVSKATADLLSEEGNGKWTELCDETVYMEGQKDKMQLFLLK